MSTPIDARERSELCELMLEVGPDAPTLCEGWVTADLAAHLVLREHFHRWTIDRMAAEKAKGFEHNVGRLRAGAPPVPWRVPVVRTTANGLEYFIHHEDVRRANGGRPRGDIPELDRVAWRMIWFLGRRIAAGISPYALEIALSNGRRHTFGSGATVTLSGNTSEVVLFLSGRRAAAEVELSGEPQALDALKEKTVGL